MCKRHITAMHNHLKQPTSLIMQTRLQVLARQRSVRLMALLPIVVAATLVAGCGDKSKSDSKGASQAAARVNDDEITVATCWRAPIWKRLPPPAQARLPPPKSASTTTTSLPCSHSARSTPCKSSPFRPPKSKPPTPSPSSRPFTRRLNTPKC